MKQEILEQIKRKAEPVLRSHDVEFAGIFGSFARGQERATSDIDFVIRYAIPKGLFELIRLTQDLKEVLGRDVDVVTEKALHPYIKKSAIENLKIMYGQRRDL